VAIDRFAVARRSSSRSSVATTSVPAAPAAGFKRCCMQTGEYDGAERDYYVRDN